MLSESTGTRLTETVHHEEAAQPSASEHGAYVIVPMARQDVDEVARLHVASFGDSFLATMGVPFLRHYFQAFIDDPLGCARICRRRETDEIVGFVCGSEDVAHHWRSFLLHRGIRATPSIIRRLVRSPHLAAAVGKRAWRMSRIVLSRRFSVDTQPQNPAPALPPASLMSIGVHPQCRRQGVGEMLVRAFVCEMGLRGVDAVKLGVRRDNRSARNLYERLDWHPAASAVADGNERQSMMYVREIGWLGNSRVEAK